MQEFILDNYQLIKAFHIISVIAWMAGLLYLPRLFVYHTKVKVGSEMSETFKIMERRLLRIIMNPAMIFAWIFGCLMLWGNSELLKQPWIHAKLTAIIILTIFHHMLAIWFKRFARDENKTSEKTFRIANEVPSFLMVIIVVLAILKPF